MGGAIYLLDSIVSSEISYGYASFNYPASWSERDPAAAMPELTRPPAATHLAC